MGSRLTNLIPPRAHFFRNGIFPFFASLFIFTFSACGTQINSLRQTARTSGASGVPPGVTSLTVTNLSPTNTSPLSLTWGIEIGVTNQYCILENSTFVPACIWRAGPLPSQFTDGASDGPLVLSAYVKNSFGTSDVITSNTVTIDRTPPVLASVTITNSDPTNTTTYGLTYGSVTNPPYSDYCIQANNTSFAACSWTTGTLPVNFVVPSVDGPYAISVWLRDSAGNPSVRATSAAVNLVQGVPTVAFSTPAASSYFNATGISSVSVTGTCSASGENVVLSGAASATVPCTGGTWSATLNLSAAPEGALTLYADHSNAASTAAIQASRSFTKDTIVPTVAVSNPIAGSSINLANQAAFAVDGTCSENGRNVVITGDATATVVCSAGTWSASLSFVSAPQGSVTILVNHSDAAGNAATQASRTFTKDTVAPSLAIVNPAANSYINAASVASFTVDGTCSENTRNVVITGDASATVTCSGGTWSANLNFSAAAQGSVSISVDHSDANGNSATTQTRNFLKDTVVPTVAVANPAANTVINTANVASFAVDGTCSENTRNVVISGAASATVTCSGGTWSANLDFTAAGQGSVTINVNHSDVAGNPATQDSRNFLKDTVLPLVAITSPAANSGVYSVNFSTFAVNGTCSENTRNVVITGAASATVTCSGGAWNASLDFTSASDGPVTINVNHSDASGNNAVQASRTFTKDTGIPTLTIASPAANSYIGAASVSSFAVSGACSENGENVVITGSASATVVCASGAWSANLDFSGAADGVVSIAVNHSDAVGNPAVTQNLNLNKDVGVPTVAITSPAANAYINAASVAAFSVSGTCSENTRNVVITGSASATVTCTTGTWSANLDFSAAAQGSVTINVNHSDAAGNAATQDSRNFLKDTVLPTVAISSPAASSYITATSVAAFAVSGTCSEDTRNVVISGDASATVACSSGTWSTNLNFTSASQGAVSINIDHSDAAGNPATQDSRGFIKDTVIPTVAISTPAANAYINAASVSAFVVAGTCSENTRNVVITGSATGTYACAAGSWTKSLDFSGASDGTVTVYANHSDAAGNAATQDSRDYIRDTTAPSMALTSPSGAYRGGDTLSVVLSASDALSGMSTFTLRYAADGTTFSDVVVLANSATSYSWSIPAADVATAKLRVVGVDVAGNTTTITSTAFTIDSTAPAAPGITLASANPTNSTAATLTVASCTDRAKIYVSESAVQPAYNAGGWQTCSTGAGAITATLSTGDGTKTLYAFAQDAVGNVSTSNNVTVVLMQNPPAPPAIVFTANATTTLATTSASATMTVASCTGRAFILINEVGTLPSVGDAGWVACSTGAGAHSYTVVGQGTHAVKVWAKDTIGNISATSTAMSFTYDVTAPVITGLVLNSGATYAGSSVITARVTSTDSYTSATHIRLVQSNTGTGACQSEYANNNWQTYATSGIAQDFTVLVSAADGVKGICAWAKDSVGNISTIITPPTGNPGYASIILQIGNPPVVTSLSATNNVAGGNFGTRTYAAGNQVLISWTITDVEGLDNNPITLSYSTDGVTWIPIISGYGGLTGNPTTSSGNYTGFSAPAGYFIIALVAKDMAGNTSAIAISDAQNTGAWSVYAGTGDVRAFDSGPLTARLFNQSAAAPFAINTATGDVYAIDDGVGIKKYNATTGVVSIVIAQGTNNMPVSGAIPASPKMSVDGYRRLKLDSKMRLYYPGGTFPNEYIQQIDFATGQTRRYVGGGLSVDQTTATSSTINFRNSPYGFDEQDSIYFYANCEAGVSSPTAVKMIKATQNPDGTPGSLSHVAGNCVYGSGPVSGIDAKTQPLNPTDYFFNVGSLSVWNNGASIVYRLPGQFVFKIMNGISYVSNISTSTYTAGAYNSTDLKYYIPDSNFALQRCTINEAGANGDTCTVAVKATGTGACTIDGINAVSAACINNSNEPAVGAGGTVFFADAQGTYYRIRYVDSLGMIRTLMGSKPFYGDGLDKRFSQGSFKGIYYKQSSDATVFGTGLYFLETNGRVFGKMDESTGAVSVLYGDQSGRADSTSDGTTVSNALPMGSGTTSGRQGALTFDSTGVPWFRMGQYMASLDASGKIIHRQTTGSSWGAAAEGSNPKLVSSYYYGPYGITMKGSGIFFIGADGSSPMIAYHDYSSVTGVQRIMGNFPSSYSPANSTPGSVINLPLSCGYGNPCATYYSVADDRLYYSDSNNIRYITTPTNTLASTLVDVVTGSNGSITGFTFSSDGLKLFYRSSSTGLLYCFGLPGAPAWCNNSSVGPPTGMNTLSGVPNQMTWKDANTLLISNGRGQILQYIVP